MFFQFASSVASKVRLVKTSIRLVCCTWSRRYYYNGCKNWMLEYGKYSEYENVLSEALYSEAQKVQCSEGAIFDSLRDGICMATSAVESYLRDRARKITTFEEIAQVATIAAGGDREIGEIVAKAKTTVGDKAEFLICDGDGKTPNIEFDSYNEMVLYEWPPISPYFCTNYVLRNPLVLIHEKNISNLDIIKLAIGQATQSSRPLLIVAKEMERAVLGYLIADKTCIGTKACVIIPGWPVNHWKGIMEDLAILTGGQVLDEVCDMNFAHKMPLMLGSCKKVILDDNKIIVHGGSGDWVDVHRRCEQLKSTVEISTSSELKNDYTLKERILQLSGGAAILKVGGASEVEVTEKKDRVNKAVKAATSAMENGIVPGNGVALLYASKELDNLQTANSNEKIGIQLLQNALKMPLHIIASNAGVDGSIVIDKLLNQENPDFGFDLLTGEYTDMIKSGIVEPVPVTTSVLDLVFCRFLSCIKTYVEKRTKEAAA